MSAQSLKKKLVIVNGPPGVGKTTVCQKLYKSIDKSVWLDGDWCWMMSPFVVNQENKQMVEDNITYMLSNFLQNSSIETIIFNWVIPKETVFDSILDKLTGIEFDLYRFTLVASESSLKERMTKDGRCQELIQRSVTVMDTYRAMSTIKIDTSEIDADAIQLVIKRHIQPNVGK